MYLKFQQGAPHKGIPASIALEFLAADAETTDVQRLSGELFKRAKWSAVRQDVQFRLHGNEPYPILQGYGSQFDVDTCLKVESIVPIRGMILVARNPRTDTQTATGTSGGVRKKYHHGEGGYGRGLRLRHWNAVHT
jgi:hypothetical protein